MHRFRLIHHEHSSRTPCVAPARIEGMLPEDGFGDWHIRTFRNGSVHVFGWYYPESSELAPYSAAVPFTVKLRRTCGETIFLDVRATKLVEDYLFEVFLSAFAPVLRSGILAQKEECDV